MIQFLTLNKKDERFRAYIDGTFSQSCRALPVQSLNVNTDLEQVTFQIVTKEKIYSQGLLSLLRAALRALKIRHWGLALMPALLVAALNLHQEQKLSLVYFSSVLGALCLLITAGLRNEVRDHRSGLDRLFPQAGSQVIQQGWFTAIDLSRASILFLCLAVLFGLPAILQNSLLLVLIAIVLMISAWIYFGDSIGLKFRHFTEWLVFFILGPLLTLGLQFSVQNGFQQNLLSQVLFIGFLCGGAALYFLFMKNWTQILVLGQAHLHNHNLHNTVTWLGFEKSKLLLEKTWLMLVAAFLVYHWSYASPFWFVVMVLASGFVSIVQLRVLRQIQSPVGSGLAIYKKLSSYALTFLSLLWLLQAYWDLLF